MGLHVQQSFHIVMAWQYVTHPGSGNTRLIWFTRHESSISFESFTSLLYIFPHSDRSVQPRSFNYYPDPYMAGPWHARPDPILDPRTLDTSRS